MSYSDHDPKPPRGTVRPREPATPPRPTNPNNGALVLFAPSHSEKSPRSTPPKKQRTNGPPAQTYSAATRAASPDPPPTTENSVQQPLAKEFPFDKAAKGFDHFLVAFMAKGKPELITPAVRGELLACLEATCSAARIQYTLLREIGWPEDGSPPAENFAAFLHAQTHGPTKPANAKPHSHTGPPPAVAP